jgi:hypothetical protein
MTETYMLSRPAVITLSATLRRPNRRLLRLKNQVLRIGYYSNWPKKSAMKTKL